MLAEPFELVLGDFSRRKLETTQDLVLACGNVDRAMHTVFGRNVDLLVEKAEHITANAERENMGVDILEDRIQQMLKVIHCSKEVTTDMRLDEEWHRI